jgi:hypothetical protein
MWWYPHSASLHLAMLTPQPSHPQTDTKPPFPLCQHTHTHNPPPTHTFQLSTHLWVQLEAVLGQVLVQRLTAQHSRNLDQLVVVVVTAEEGVLQAR